MHEPKEPGGWQKVRFLLGRASESTGPPILVAVVLIAVAILLLPMLAVQLHRVPLPKPSTLPLDFPHQQHAGIPCQMCHHNFADHTGMENCIPCHRSARVERILNVQTVFHQFCEDCHIKQADGGQATGPIHRCAGCHRGA